MGSALELNEHNFHEVTVDSQRLLFHIPSSSLFEADAASVAVIAELRRGGSDTEAELGARLAGRLD
ncbi:MAG: quinohemoprotein amine dehydrogenase maturase, partial [Gammaproteobacteria bacterium]|nr:quinohemoprotein amine dehydrogenase maturase [Gammaproteobacteria bacterium]